MSSDIFSVIDEVFGLILLYNEHHVWEHQRRTKSNNALLRKRKQFCDAKNGNKDVCIQEGQELFSGLCRVVVLLPNEPESSAEMEKLLQERFQKEAGNYVIPNSKTDTSRALKNKNKMYIDPAMAMMSGDMLQSAVTQEDDILMDN